MWKSGFPTKFVCHFSPISVPRYQRALMLLDVERLWGRRAELKAMHKGLALVRWGGSPITAIQSTSLSTPSEYLWLVICYCKLRFLEGTNLSLLSVPCLSNLLSKMCLLTVPRWPVYDVSMVVHCKHLTIILTFRGPCILIYSYNKTN
jgi:hypothetical protein